MSPENVAETTNKGFDGQIGYQDRFGNFNFNTNFVFGYAKNRVDYKAEAQQKYEWLRETGRQIGQPFGYHWIGYYTPEDIEKINSLDILATSKDAGVYLVAEKDGSRFFVTGHPEYDPDTLDKEYHRDLVKGDECVMPKNYYKNNDVNGEILVKWRSHAYLLFSNWLNYYVYQSTPYNLDDLEKMKTPQ